MSKNKTLIIPKQIVTADASNTVLLNSALEITDDTITNIAGLSEFNLENYSGRILDIRDQTLIPGFVQTHVHLCQTLFRGLADDLELLDWLQKRIFPYENSHSRESLKLSAQLGLNELISGGTTTVLDMGTMNHQEVIFEELKTSGMRAVAGKCMIDENDLFPSFRESTSDSLRSANELAKAFHNSNDGLIKYGFAPRFVLSCSEHLLIETREMMRDFEGSIFHTHSSENKSEIAAVRKKHNKENIEYFNSIGVLGSHTVLAHCIHLNENEISILKDSNTRVAHCPSSNLKLGSGIADIPRYLKEGISVSIGADGAPCNNRLCAFTEMRLAALIQKPRYSPTTMDALTVFRAATIEGAKALHLENETGSIETGKKADLVTLDLELPQQTLSDNPMNIYSGIVYSAGRENVRNVFINGKCLLRDSRSLIYDEKKLYHDGKQQLKKLLSRAAN